MEITEQDARDLLSAINCYLLCDFEVQDMDAQAQSASERARILQIQEKLKNIKNSKSIWHDLTVNPDDLPEKCGPYIVFTNVGYGESNFYKIQTDKNEWLGRFDTSWKVYAWCENHFERDSRWEKKESKVNG